MLIGPPYRRCSLAPAHDAGNTTAFCRQKLLVLSLPSGSPPQKASISGTHASKFPGYLSVEDGAQPLLQLTQRYCLAEHESELDGL